MRRQKVREEDEDVQGSGGAGDATEKPQASDEEEKNNEQLAQGLQSKWSNWLRARQHAARTMTRKTRRHTAREISRTSKDLLAGRSLQANNPTMQHTETHV